MLSAKPTIFSSPGMVKVSTLSTRDGPVWIIEGILKALLLVWDIHKIRQCYKIVLAGAKVF